MKLIDTGVIPMVRCSVVVWMLMTTFSFAADSGYQLPPREVVDLITAPPEPAIGFSPDGEWMLFVERDALPKIADLARRRLHLAGIRIDPVANGPFRTDYAVGLSIRRRSDKSAQKLPLAAGSLVAGIQWSQDSQRFVYTLVTERGTELWGFDINQPKEPKLLTASLVTVFGGFEWLPDGKSLLCRLVPAQRGSEPAAPRKPSGPNVQESVGNTSPQRTYQDLLANPHDELLFEHYVTSQLAIVDFDGKSRLIGQPAIWSSAEPSPDGRFILTTRIKRPYSYTLPYSSFPKEIAVLDQNGKQVVLVADVPLEENIPIEGVRVGPRHVGWTSSDPATLDWIEALDGGDPRVKAEHRDKIVRWSAPFQNRPTDLLKVEHRVMGASYFADRALLAVTEYDRDRRWTRTLLHDVDHPNTAPKTLDDRSIRERYADPGDLVKTRNAQGHTIVRQEGDWVYLSGAGATPEGLLPFVDRRNLKTLETERLWRCEPGYLETLALLVATPNGKPRIITRQESPTLPPNFWLRTPGETQKQTLTEFRDPSPQIRGIKKELVTYKRKDGVPLSATLYLPADYKPGTKLPLFIWAYPLEFSDAATAGQVAMSPWQFTRIRGASHLALLTQGYAVMDNATMPVVGSPETMNDTFVEQIVSSAQAAIDKAVELGVADRERVAVGGHSYGSFMTANLLAHCDLFRAGIARSGAFNRTLTPFGFQAERRPLWQAKDIYLKLSPFMHADKIKTPILLIHGENDENSGTFPLQSQRMFQAIKGNGGTVRLCMLPHEGHGYAAEESVLHVQAETIAWLNRYVRGEEKPKAESGKPGE